VTSLNHVIVVCYVTSNMKREVSLIIITIIVILRCRTCIAVIQCFVCESEKDELICKNPNEISVRSDAVLCPANGQNVTCSTTVYKRKCIDEGKVTQSRLLLSCYVAT